MIDSIYSYKISGGNTIISNKENEITISNNLFNSSSNDLGLYIKSQLKNFSSSLYSKNNTNFIYEIDGPTILPKTLSSINSMIIKRGKKELADVKGRVKAIYSNHNSLKFNKVEKPTFGNNLVLIDSLLPQIISEIVKNYFSNGNSKLSDITNSIETDNPLHFDKSQNHNFYSYKIKRFLTDIALGMMPSKVWDGQYDTTGGYLIVKENGSILCYHLYNKNDFEDYLLNNTKLETASTSRHQFGEIYEENGVHLFKLNLQIRFIK